MCFDTCLRKRVSSNAAEIFCPGQSSRSYCTVECLMSKRRAVGISVALKPGQMERCHGWFVSVKYTKFQKVEG